MIGGEGHGDGLIVEGSKAPEADPLADLLGGLDELAVGSLTRPQPSTSGTPSMPLLSSKSGLEIRGNLASPSSPLAYHLSLTNTSVTPLDGFFLTMNKNPRGLAVATQKLDIDVLGTGQTVELTVPLVETDAMRMPGAASGGFTLQLAMKNNQTGVIYFTDTV